MFHSSLVGRRDLGGEIFRRIRKAILDGSNEHLADSGSRHSAGHRAIFPAMRTAAGLWNGEGMGKVMTAAVLAAALCSGWLGGYITAFSDVTGGLERVPDAMGIATMQPMTDVVMENALFFLAFLGTPILSLILAVVALREMGRAGSWAILVGSVLIVVGVFGVTVGIHVPLNDSLAELDPASAAAADVWRTFLDRWLLWNHVRAISGVAAAAEFLLALIARVADSSSST